VVEPRDKIGMILCEGDCVARAYRCGNVAALELRVVTRIGDGKVWLDNSKTPVTRTDRLLVYKPAQ
jgi:hypothetical protein